MMKCYLCECSAHHLLQLNITTFLTSYNRLYEWHIWCYCSLWSKKWHRRKQKALMPTHDLTSSFLHPPPDSWWKACCCLCACFSVPVADVAVLLWITTTPPPPTTVLPPFVWDHPGEPVPEENFWTLCCKGRLTEADTPTIRLGATPSGLTSAHHHHPPHIFLQDRCPSCRPTNNVKTLKATSAFGLGRRC